ncbi:MAG: type II toxin-antitoxin system YoeB family toxin [Bacteroidales bacterium]|nr:type II toxin-antitoxin system YoeB family toxin [Bacteroidales bacterium]
MNLVFNELSIYPLAENGHLAEANFRKLLETFKEAKKVYGFTHIRFPNNYSGLQITTNETFFEWLSSLTNRTIKNLIIDICKRPFTDELEEDELNEFYESNYSLVGENIPIEVEPVGLPVSYIKAMPAISLDSHSFWKNRKIIVRKLGGFSIENNDFVAFNICLVSDLTTPEIEEWADFSMPNFINSKEVLIKYLRYTKYQCEFTERFMHQFFLWKTENFDMFKYLLLLMKDIQFHPFSGGMGQTENLKGRSKEASKRLSNSYPDGDRLSYTIENNLVIFIACKGHYKFRFYAFNCG